MPQVHKHAFSSEGVSSIWDDLGLLAGARRLFQLKPSNYFALARALQLRSPDMSGDRPARQLSTFGMDPRACRGANGTDLGCVERTCAAWARDLKGMVRESKRNLLRNDSASRSGGLVGYEYQVGVLK